MSMKKLTMMLLFAGVTLGAMAQKPSTPPKGGAPTGTPSTGNLPGPSGEKKAGVWKSNTIQAWHSIHIVGSS